MSKEYIDREAFKDEYLCCGYLPEMSEDEFDAFPAADVAPVVHGRWRWVAYDANPKIGNWHCTYCNRIPKSFQKEDFCPNCGAKMDKEDAWKDDALGQKED